MISWKDWCGSLHALYECWAVLSFLLCSPGQLSIQRQRAARCIQELRQEVQG